jgi:hypothetical protein
MWKIYPKEKLIHKTNMIIYKEEEGEENYLSQ